MMNYSSQQEILNKVAAHLIKQGVMSANSLRCAYRGDGGTACAIGHLIPDEAYRPELECSGIYELRARMEAFKIPLPRWLCAENMGLLARLQEIHNQYMPRPKLVENDWRTIWAVCKQLSLLSLLYGLQIPECVTDYLTKVTQAGKT